MTEHKGINVWPLLFLTSSLYGGKSTLQSDGFTPGKVPSPSLKRRAGFLQRTNVLKKIVALA
jgi:hypothetical protein